ncbi:HAD family hydrolase [Candidatus Parcubacteria bacterium]|nr:MAG: HAD family hydrolase [Candidatus Parcubacteria bacterium]
MKKVILVDLDHTLIRTAYLKQRAIAVAGRLGVAKKIARENLDSAIAGKPFHIRSYARRLGGSKHQRAMLLKEFLKLHEEPKKYNFPGVEHFLRRLSRRFTLMVLTHGHPEYQRWKIDQSKLLRFFNRVIATKEHTKRRELLRFYKKFGSNITLIDDSRIVVAVARNIGMRAILVRKGRKDERYYRQLSRRIETQMGGA